MATLINKDKQISKQRQEFVEHNFEAMVGARKRRYNDTQAQKQRTEFFEDYYLLHTRNKNKWQKLKEFIIKKQEEYQADIVEQEMQGSIPNSISFYARYNLCNEIQKKMQDLEGENAES